MRRCARAAASAAGLTRRAAETFLGGAIRAELPAAYHTSSARCGAIVSANALRARTFLPRAAARADAAPFALRAARHLRVSTPIADEHLSKNIVRDVLTNAKAVAIREDIDNLRASSDDKPCVSHLALADFNSLLTSHGVTEPAEQAELIRAFQHAGVVIKFEDVVYLNPSRITRDVLRALPAVPSRVFGATPEELAEMEEEMAATREKVEDAASRARFRSNMIIGVGLLALVTQLFLFIRLTYVELSWDVMEPISYFVGVFNAILVYLYFMVYNRDFSFDDWSSRMQKHFWKRNIGGIDMQSADATTISEFNASGIVFKDSVEVVAVKDPQVDGVTLYLSDFKRSVSAKLQSGDIFSEPSQTSLACVRDELAEGGVVIRGDLGGREGKEVFAERKNLNLLNNKTLRIRRVLHRENGTLVYVSYSTRTSSADAEGPSAGQYKTSICVVPLRGNEMGGDPAGGAK